MGVGCHGSHDYLQRSTLVNSEKYIGLDVHQATISVAVMDSGGKLVMESILETKAATILQFFAGLRGTLCVTFEEGTCAAWLYDLLNPHVAKLVVCNPRKNVRRELVADDPKHPATATLRQIPYLGPIRSALLVALIQTPHRFRTKRQLWAYSGLALETRTSAEYRYVEGQLRHSKKLLSIRGLNKDHNHDLKALFKAASITASVRPGPFQDFYQALLRKGMKPTMARLTLARKMAAITLTLWKKGEGFDGDKLKPQAA